jgi:hypothetical protein
MAAALQICRQNGQGCRFRRACAVPRGCAGAVLVLSGLLLAGMSPGGATADDRIRLTAVAPAVVAETLTIDLACEELFSRRSTSTLQSGLPAVVRIDVQVRRATRTRTLLGGRGSEYETVHSTQIVRAISYDVWDERYTIRSRNDVVTFTDFVPAELALQRYSQEPVVALAAIEPATPHTVRVRAQLVSVSSERGDELAAWLRDGGTGLSDERRGDSFAFGVRDLVSVFWGHSEKGDGWSAWSYSRAFTVSLDGELSD